MVAIRNITEVLADTPLSLRNDPEVLQIVRETRKVKKDLAKLLTRRELLSTQGALRDLRCTEFTPSKSTMSKPRMRQYLEYVKTKYALKKMEILMGVSKAPRNCPIKPMGKSARAVNCQKMQKEYDALLRDLKSSPFHIVLASPGQVRKQVRSLSTAADLRKVRQAIGTLRNSVAALIEEVKNPLLNTSSEDELKSLGCSGAKKI